MALPEVRKATRCSMTAARAHVMRKVRVHNDDEVARGKAQAVHVCRAQPHLRLPRSQLLHKHSAGSQAAETGCMRVTHSDPQRYHQGDLRMTPGICPSLTNANGRWPKYHAHVAKPTTAVALCSVMIIIGEDAIICQLETRTRVATAMS